MKTKLLITIIAMTLLAGLIIAGGVLLTERNSDISTEDKSTLGTAGIDDVVVSWRCNDEYCLYDIFKEGHIDSRDNIIYKYKDVCELNEETRENICTSILKTEEELIAERDAKVDAFLERLAKNIEEDNAKGDLIIEPDEKVIIVEKKGEIEGL